MTAQKMSVETRSVCGSVMWLGATWSTGYIECDESEQADDPMPIKSQYLFVVSMDVDPDKEALFNEVYDTEHVPNLLKVPGVHAAARMESEPFVISIGGEEKRVAQAAPRYSVVYEIDGPHVLVSPEWAKASEAGRWPTAVRPFTRNRRHALYKLR